MNEATQTGVAMAAIGLVGTIAGLFFGWLKDRDKIKFDKKLTDQAAQIQTLTTQNATQGTQMAAQATQIATLTTTQADCEKKHKECEEKHKTTETRIEALEGKLGQK